MPLVEDDLSKQVIGCAIAVHRALGPGLFESSYDECAAIEFRANGLRCRRQVPLSITYREVVLPHAYRVDFIVEEQLLLEIKSVDRTLPVHHAQVLTYMKLSGLRHGLLINFNVPRLVDGVKSFLR